MNDLRTISREDNIFATIVAKGKTIKSIFAHNFASINEIINALTSECSDFNGLAQLNVRNQSQGWSLNMLLRIKGTPKRSFSQALHAIPPHDGLQFRLAF